MQTEWATFCGIFDARRKECKRRSTSVPITGYVQLFFTYVNILCHHIRSSYLVIIFGHHIPCPSYSVISHLKGISKFFNHWTQNKRNSFIFVTPSFFLNLSKKTRIFLLPPDFVSNFCQKIWKFSTKILGTPGFFSSIFVKKIWNCDNFLATQDFFFR